MSNDPMDHEAHKFADKCEAIDQRAELLNRLLGEVEALGIVKVWPTEDAKTIDCEMEFRIDAARPLRSFVELMHELSEQALAIWIRENDEAEKRAAEQGNGD